MFGRSAKTSLESVGMDSSLAIAPNSLISVNSTDSTLLQDPLGQNSHPFNNSPSSSSSPPPPPNNIS
ncbi:MAG: hypothetical protein AB4290_28935 [Spirulina sp.]